MEGTSKTPLLLEIQVPPLCFPILVGDPKGNILRWIERPSKNNTVISWGISVTEDEIHRVMLKMVDEFSDLWEIHQKTLEDAKNRMNRLGIEEITQIDNLVIPLDPSLLGTLVYVGDKIFPVIHNISRGLCILPSL